MTEPPRSPGEGYPDPNSVPPHPASGGGAYPPPTSGGGAYPPGGGYDPPPGGYPPGGYPPAGGYPPGGGYPAGGGYPPGGGYGPPTGFASGEEKTWALVAHFGGAGGVLIAAWLGFVAPLVAMLSKGPQSPTVRAHAVEALNFQLTWLGVSFVLFSVICCASVLTLGIGAVLFVLMGLPWLVSIIFGVIAGVKANDGQFYRYPMTIRLVK